MTHSTGPLRLLALLASLVDLRTATGLQPQTLRVATRCVRPAAPAPHRGALRASVDDDDDLISFDETDDEDDAMAFAASDEYEEDDADAVELTAEETVAAKRVRKLKKALKRIGELRLQDYNDLTQAQKEKVHGEHKVLRELQDRAGRNVDVEALRVSLQPGLRLPMPVSKPWSSERDSMREKAKKIAQASGVRPGDWFCSKCKTTCFETRSTCFKCGAVKGAARGGRREGRDAY
ncbi:hypothetical protein M885DRAFT_518636 [Pelagophyceae sp. CCMP2097]|nr:hypothetical protein M885DRAFT_518636 [Pelagophyceae sp. CCMP2097]